MALSRPQLRHGTPAVYVENAAPVVVCATITLADRDSTVLVGAVVHVTTGIEAGLDVLGFVNQNGITGSWDAASGTLTLTGSATVADYEAALNSVTYAYLGDDPLSGGRTLTYQVDDGSSLSRQMSVRLGVVAVNDPPVLAVDPTLAYTRFQAPAVLDATLTLVDPDSVLRGETVRIAGNYHAGEDVLSWVNSGRVHGRL